jgi:hypothetical protein
MGPSHSLLFSFLGTTVTSGSFKEIKCKHLGIYKRRNGESTFQNDKKDNREKRPTGEKPVPVLKWVVQNAKMINSRE